MTQKKKKIRRWAEFIIIAVIILMTAYILNRHSPAILVYLRNNDIDGLTDYIRGEGQLGEVFLVGLQVIETISVFLPALPVYICAGIIYGRLEGVLLCYITNLVMNGIMFLFAQRAGDRFTQKASNSNDKIEKIERIMTGVKRPDIGVMLLFFVPVVPNGLIPTIASRTQISFRRFIGAVAVGSFPAIAFYVICGDALLTVDRSLSVPLLIVIAVATAIGIIFRKQIRAWAEPKLRKAAGEIKRLEEN